MLASDQRVIFTSTNEQVAEVYSDGTVKGMSEGYTSITVTTIDGNKKAYTGISVVSVPSSVRIITPDDFKNPMFVGDTMQLSASIVPQTVINKKVRWSISDSSIATIDQNGNLKALQEGTATVTVTTEENGLTDFLEINIVYDYGDTMFAVSSGDAKTVKKQYSLKVIPRPEIKDADYDIVWSLDDTAVASILGEGEEVIIDFNRRGKVKVTVNMIVASEIYSKEVSIESTWGEIDNVAVDYQDFIDMNANGGGNFYLGVKSDPADADLQITNVVVQSGSEEYLHVEKTIDGYRVSGKAYGLGILEIFVENNEEPFLCSIQVEKSAEVIDLEYIREGKNNLPAYYSGRNQPLFLEYKLLGFDGYEANPTVVYSFKFGVGGIIFSEQEAVDSGYIDIALDRHTLTFKRLGMNQIFIETPVNDGPKESISIMVNDGQNILTQHDLQNGFQNENPQLIFNLLDDIVVSQTSETNVFETSKSVTLNGNGYIIDATQVPVIAEHRSRGYYPPGVMVFKGTSDYGYNNGVTIRDLTVEGNLFKEPDVTRYYDSYYGIMFYPNEGGYNSNSGTFSLKRYAQATLERVNVMKNFRNIYAENIDNLVMTDVTAKYAYATNICIGGYDKATLTNLSVGFAANASLEITDYFGIKKSPSETNPNPQFQQTILKGRFDVCNWIGGTEPLFVVESEYAAFVSTFAYPYIDYFKFFTPTNPSSGEKAIQKINYAIAFYGANYNMLYEAGAIDAHGQVTGNTRGLVNMDDLENKDSI
jgi:hypothetical protein